MLLLEYVTKLQIIAILRDWSKLKAKRENNYPQHQVQILPVDLWLPTKIESYLQERVGLHQIAQTMPDNRLPLCTVEETWEKPTVYAVTKEGNKRAAKLQSSMSAAENTKASLERTNPKNKYRIDIRPEQRIRCESYCSVAPFCNQYKD